MNEDVKMQPTTIAVLTTLSIVRPFRIDKTKQLIQDRTETQFTNPAKKSVETSTS